MKGGLLEQLMAAQAAVVEPSLQAPTKSKHQRYREKIKKDPERMALIRQQNRESYARRQQAAGKVMRRSPSK